MPDQWCMDLALFGVIATRNAGSPRAHRVGSQSTSMLPSGCITVSAAIGSVVGASRIRYADGYVLYFPTDPTDHEAVNAKSRIASSPMRLAEMDIEAYFNPNSAAFVEGA